MPVFPEEEGSNQAGAGVRLCSRKKKHQLRQARAYAGPPLHPRDGRIQW
jgi:hypothetical protein